MPPMRGCGRRRYPMPRIREIKKKSPEQHSGRLAVHVPPCNRSFRNMPRQYQALCGVLESSQYGFAELCLGFQVATDR
jgi:hypothetical protein